MVVVKELLGFLKGKAQDFAYLAGRQFAFGVTLKEKRFEQGTGLRRLVQVELLGELVWDFDGNDHSTTISGLRAHGNSPVVHPGARDDERHKYQCSPESERGIDTKFLCRCEARGHSERFTQCSTRFLPGL